MTTQLSWLLSRFVGDVAYAAGRQSRMPAGDEEFGSPAADPLVHHNAFSAFGHAYVHRSRVCRSSRGSRGNSIPSLHMGCAACVKLTQDEPLEYPANHDPMLRIDL